MDKKFTVVDSESQRVVVIYSQATTLRELKDELRTEGFNLDGKTIQEGLTHTELVSDDSILPHDVPVNGTTTNNLVFRLTKASKNIASGSERSDVYDAIKRRNLAEGVKETFGRNYTQVPTVDLKAYLAAKEESNCGCTSCNNDAAKKAEAIGEAMHMLLNALSNVGIHITYISSEDPLFNKLNEEDQLDVPDNADYSSKEIMDMFKDM